MKPQGYFIATTTAVLLSGFFAAVPVKTADGNAVSIGVPGRANANASIASSGSFVGVAWTGRTPEGATDVYSATSRDAGRIFSAPVRVNHVAGDASVSGEQPPRIALTPGRGATPGIVVLWTAKSPNGTRLVSARSADGGKSFGARMTSQAQAASPLAKVGGLAFLGFPLHPAGKPSDERGQHLFQVKIPMLFLQGARDALADTNLLGALVQQLGSRATLKLFPDADHSFHVPARSGRNDADVRSELLDDLAAWMESISG